MTTLTLKHRRFTHPHGHDYRAVYGRHGVICWATTTNPAMPYTGIETHSARPHAGVTEPIPCELLEWRCYFSIEMLAGGELRRDWDQAGCDENVIYGRLERCYRDWLADPS
jgi:hypothetical protein